MAAAVPSSGSVYEAKNSSTYEAKTQGKPQATPNPAQIRQQIIDRAADAIIKDIGEIFGKEIDEAKRLCETSKEVPKDVVTHKLPVPGEAGKFFYFSLRPSHLMQKHTEANLDEKINGLTGNKKNCFNAILDSCAHKIPTHKNFAIGSKFGFVETSIRDHLDFSKSLILRSKVLRVLPKISDNLMRLFIV